MEPTLPVIPRLDRLERLLELLEEKHSKSRKSDDDNDNDNHDDVHIEKFMDNPNCKTLFSALDDVHHKGTLIDRLAMLENRVLQLALDIGEGSTSRSSSSTAYAIKEEKEFPIDKCGTKSIAKGKRGRGYFKWILCFNMRC